MILDSEHVLPPMKTFSREVLLEETHRKSTFDRQVPRKPRLVGGVEMPNGSRGTMKNEISFPGSPGLWAGSFT
jgi:hypothetical protein